MDSKLVFVKTPVGDEAVRQSTRVVQRNLRMVLVQVDGKLSVAELSAKIGNPRLVETALRELQDGGFIAPRRSAVLGRDETATPQVSEERVSAISQFSTFGNRPSPEPLPFVPSIVNSQFSSFGKPILPIADQAADKSGKVVKKRRPKVADDEFFAGGRSRSAGRWLVGLPFVLFLLALLAVLFYPYNNLKPEFEMAAERMLHVPVQIDNVGLSWLPRPALTLSGVRVGYDGEGRVDAVRLLSPWLLWGSGPRTLAEVRIEGATLPADLLVSLPLFAASRLQDQQLPAIRRLTFERLGVVAGDGGLRDLSGVVLFKPDAGVESAEFQNFDQGIRLKAEPSTGGLVLDIHGSGWQPLGASLRFDSLQAKGLLQKGKLLVQNLDTTFLGGVMRGGLLLDWSDGGVALAGEGVLLRIDCRKLSAALVPNLQLDGELGGSLRLRARGRDWSALWQGVEAHLDADIERGMLHGLDLGEAVRRGAGAVVRAGSTKFESLHAGLTIGADRVEGRDVRMSAGMVTAGGQFNAVRGRPVDALLQLTMRTSVSTVRATVRVGGELPELSAVSVK